jgi:trk system potassium uptake protein TrkH
VAGYSGGLLAGIGVLMLIPAVMAALLDGAAGRFTVPAFLVPGIGVSILGLILNRLLGGRPITNARAMLVCCVGWFAAAVACSIPYRMALGTGPVDSLFESMAGLTTTGFTVFRTVERLPASLAFWRCFTQWLGGLGILTFFLAVSSQAPGAHMLLGAESSKIRSSRPVPGIANTLRIMWVIYGCITLASVLILLAGGMGPFDAVCHGLATASTGGFSTRDASIAWFTPSRGANPYIIQYGLVACMLMGATNFLIIYKVFTGNPGSAVKTVEARLWWFLLLLFTGVVFAEKALSGSHEGLEETFRHSLFTVASLMSSTGFVVSEMSSSLFGPVARHCFAVMLLVGGCVGSTSGGLKVLRIGILMKSAGQEVSRLFNPRRAVSGVRIDGQLVSRAEVQRASAIFFLWLVSVFTGGAVIAWFSGMDGARASSIMASAMGNMGPSLMPMGGMSLLPRGLKLLCILGMLAGRLEILPLLMLFRRSAWK